MPIDFFKPGCQGTSKHELFGLCDDEDLFPAETPAYIDEATPTTWIAEVKNPRLEEVTFTAIDNCIEILRPDGGKEYRCDGMLTSKDSLIFVELKDRASSGWVKKGLQQLETTSGIFSANHDITAYTHRQAYISNKQRPLFANSYNSIIQQFKNDTGLILNIQRQIEI